MQLSITIRIAILVMRYIKESLSFMDWEISASMKKVLEIVLEMKDIW